MYLKFPNHEFQNILLNWKSALVTQYKYIVSILRENYFEVFAKYFLKMCPIFVGSVHNFGKSDDDIIYYKNASIQCMHLWFQTQLAQKNLYGF